jgi:hypothetical protein
MQTLRPELDDDRPRRTVVDRPVVTLEPGGDLELALRALRRRVDRLRGGSGRRRRRTARGRSPAGSAGAGRPGRR